MKRLGNSDIELTRIGFGAWAIGGNGWEFGWGAQDDNQSIEAIRRALERGMNWIDTARIYGLGHSEEIVAKALDSVSKRPYIFTKCGIHWDANRKNYYSLKKIREECEGSLRRLKVDAIDLYQIHRPTEGEIEEGWTAMAELQREGKVRWIGVSNFDVAQMELAMKIAPITSLQPPYSMLNRTYEVEALPFCAKHGIGVIHYSPMVSGLLTGAMTKERVAQMPEDDFRKRAKQFQEPLLTKNLELASFLGEIGKRHGVSAGVVAIAWTMRNPNVTAAIVGGRSGAQVDGVMPAMTFELSDAEAKEIEARL